ncbi:hypothetical protein [Streptomyces lancefieldiae]|uniref:Uncharacterized protein n=1 Tax=Streptomyces lancefieldiae TaxID=3075520 RepID=A0ABU3B1I2_9ACTN|nr:hypothetical protein [Streptomyces sp. DSM 40712]MDT0616109.1 hypothetical protein [Streptomyces sp. DSM 40712]
MTSATIPLRPAHPVKGYGRLLVAADRALRAFAATDAASALAYGLRHGDALVAARGQGTVERLVQEGRL